MLGGRRKVGATGMNRVINSAAVIPAVGKEEIDVGNLN
jgi:hypothetical protein